MESKPQAGNDSTSPNSAATGTKRKRQAETKFYSVRSGFKPGIYTSWEECLAQIKGFKGARFKSFTTQDDAQAFLGGQDPTQNPTSASYQPRFYAVRRGREPGIYEDWAQVQNQIRGWTKPEHKVFATRAEAEDYLTNNPFSSTLLSGQQLVPPSVGSPQLNFPGQPAGSERGNGTGHPEKEPEPSEKRPIKKTKHFDDIETPVKPKGNILHIYTDGSSIKNGQAGAIAGVGVWFGTGDERNVSEPLSGIRQTNQRAELTAILRALEIAPKHREVLIYSDSTYAIKCATEWAPNWLRNNWRTSAGKPVENRDLVEKILAEIDARKAGGVLTRFQWVKGHADDAGNSAADLLAVAGARSSQV